MTVRSGLRFEEMRQDRLVGADVRSTERKNRMKTSVKVSLALSALVIVIFWFNGNRIALPPEPAITEIKVKLDGHRPEAKGLITNSFTVAKIDYGQFLGLFADAKRTRIPMKWQYLGRATITTTAKKTTVIQLYSTYRESGAFSIDRKYFRTVSEPETMKFLTSDNRTKLEGANSPQR
jgi:hypothetical protein